MQCLVAEFLIVLALILQPASAARILGVFAHPVRSNTLFTHAVMDTLAAAGHDVTVYSAFQPKPDSGFRHVHITQGPKIIATNFEDYVKKFTNVGFGGSLLRTFSHSKSESFMKHPSVQRLLHSNETFDVVFTGAPFGEESLLVFGHVFKAPTVSLLPSGTYSAVDYMAGNALSISFSPDYFAFSFTDKMSLVERLQNALSTTASLLWYHWYDLPGHDAILQRHASSLNPPPPTTYEMARDVALTFANVHPTVSYSKPLPPNIILVGGIHIQSASEALPQDIQKIMDDAKEGVIFCSLGSIVPVDTMPPIYLQAFTNAFRKLPQKIIWKISSTSLPEIPDNVMVSSWLPQQQLLKHPNLKVFLTHGGLNSQLEALRSGVPVVGMPFFSDQPYNVQFYEHLGVGVGLRLDTLSEETITTALQTVLNNSRYAENARRVARLYADQPLQPAASVVYWTEYILRHGGTHLRPQAALLSWYQRALLDVVGVVVVSVAIVLFLTVQLTRSIYRWIRVTNIGRTTKKKHQ